MAGHQDPPFDLRSFLLGRHAPWKSPLPAAVFLKNPVESAVSFRRLLANVSELAGFCLFVFVLALLLTQAQDLHLIYLISSC